MKHKNFFVNKKPKKKKIIKKNTQIIKYSEQWYENSCSIRKECLNIITHIDRYSDEKISEAVFDLYYVSQAGDERYLFPLLNSGRHYIVCQAIHTLGRMEMFESIYPFLLDIIDNNNDFNEGLRDEAIFQISRYAKKNKLAAEKMKRLFSDSIFNALSFSNQLSVLEGICYLTNVTLSKDENNVFMNRTYSPYINEYERLRKILTEKINYYLNLL